MMTERPTLYKYQDWNNEYHRKALVESEVYFSSRSNFNDPFDLNIPVKLEGALPIDQKEISDSIVEIHDGSIDKDELQHHLDRNKSETLSKHREKYAQRIKDKLFSIADKYGVLCLSKREDSPLMWGHYANSCKGYCVGYDAIGLSDYFQSNVRSDLQIDHVRYIEQFPTFNLQLFDHLPSLTKTVLDGFVSKHINWKYEKELRVLVFDFCNRSFKIDKELYTKMIFGYKMNETDKKHLRILCNHLYPNMKFFQATPSTTHFNMEIKRID